MTKAFLLKILNPLLIVSALLQITGGILFAVGIIAPWMSEAHEINGFVLSGLAIFHFILNWAWVKNAFFSAKKPQKGA